MDKQLRIIKPDEITIYKKHSLKDFPFSQYEKEFEKVLRNVLKKKRIRCDNLECKIYELKTNNKNTTEIITFKVKYEVDLGFQAETKKNNGKQFKFLNQKK